MLKDIYILLLLLGTLKVIYKPTVFILRSQISRKDKPILNFLSRMSSISCHQCFVTAVSFLVLVHRRCKFESCSVFAAITSCFDSRLLHYIDYLIMKIAYIFSIQLSPRTEKKTFSVTKTFQITKDGHL